MFDVSNRLLAREVANSFTLVRLRRGSGNADIRWFVGVFRKVLYVVLVTLEDRRVGVSDRVQG